MAKKRKKKKIVKVEEPKPRRKFLIIFVCIFVAFVVVLGVVLGIISSMKKAKATASFRGVIMDDEVTSFFVSYSKNIFMEELVGEEDTPGFWNSDSGNGKTYGELLRERTKSDVARILVANYLFDKYRELTDDERKLISQVTEDVLVYKCGGSEGKFNDAVAEFGFSYSSFKEACEMLYKAQQAQSIFCGVNGENMKNQTELVNESLSEYSHVKLLILRKETTFVLDENGNRVIEGGDYKKRNLTDEEKTERELLISKIDAEIAALKLGHDGAMHPDLFDYYLSKYDEGDSDMHSLGYYFHKDSGYSRFFEQKISGITEKIYEMSIGEYRKVEVNLTTDSAPATCYIYKYETDVKDIENDALEIFFSDFYTNLAHEFYEQTLNEYIALVEYKDSFNQIDAIQIPYNYDFIPSFNKGERK